MFVTRLSEVISFTVDTIVARAPGYHTKVCGADAHFFGFLPKEVLQVGGGQGSEGFYLSD